MSRLPAGARRWLRLGSVRGDVADEITFHFERTVDELRCAGMSERDAREEAARRFGDMRTYVRELESIDSRAAFMRRMAERSEALRQMITTALRSVVRSPGLTTGVVLAFGLGIGANATMLGIIDRLLLSPPSEIADAERVRRLYVSQYIDFMGERLEGSTLSYPDYTDLLRVRGFEGVAAISTFELTVGAGESARVIPGALVSGNYFDVLGTEPVLGRFLDASTDRIGGVQEAVISYSAWQREYGGAGDVLGRTIDFGHGPYTIVGVAPRGFTGVYLEPVDVWVPLRVAGAQLLGTAWEPDPDGRGWQWLDTFARLAPDVTVAQAEAEATAVHAAARAEDIAAGNWGRDVKVIATSLIEGRSPSASSSTPVAKLLAIVSLLVLAIACVNVANLLLARSVVQRREMVVRLALGISRRRLIGQIVLEGVLLALLGGAAALAMERWAGALVRNTLLPQVAWDQVGASRLVVPVVIILAVLSGALSAVVPALQVARRDLADTIRRAGAGGLTRTTSHVRTSLALAQAALSVILLVGAGLFARSLNNVHAIDLGFDADGLAFVMPHTTADGIPDGDATPVFTRIQERLDGIPGVRAAVATALPFRVRRSASLRAEGVDSIVIPPSGSPGIHGVSASYFDVMGIDIVRGRGFSAQDTHEGAAPVAVIGESFARYLWPSDDAIGKCLYIGDRRQVQPCTEIVGVAEDAARNDLREELRLQYYVPVGVHTAAGSPYAWIVRTNGDARTFDAIRREIVAADARIRYAQLRTYADELEPETRSWRLGATMFGLFGVLALVVAAIGLYSMLSFDVAQRTREIGIRGALGASTASLLGMVLRRAVLVTLAGIVAGGLAAALLAPRVGELLFNVRARDPITFGAVATTLLFVALAASMIPALRATRVDPNVALRSE